MPLAMSVYSVRGLLGWGRRLGGLTVGAIAVRWRGHRVAARPVGRVTTRCPLAGPWRRAARWLGRARAPYGPLARRRASVDDYPLESAFSLRTCGFHQLPLLSSA